MMVNKGRTADLLSFKLNAFARLNFRNVYL